MSNKYGSNNDDLLKALVANADSSYPKPPVSFTPPGYVRIQSKRGRRSTQFSAISKANVTVVDELIELAEKLANDGKGKEAGQLIKIIRKMLNNNSELQKVVSEALADIPN